MKAGSLGLTVFVLLCAVMLQGCLLDVTSVVAPDSTTTGKVIVVTINGTATSTGTVQTGGIVLQVPLGTTVLRVHHSYSLVNQFLTENPGITAGYTAEAGYYLSGWVAQQGSDTNTSVTLKVWLAVPNGVAPRNDYRIKAAVGVYDAGNTWVPQNPQISGSPVTHFSQISGKYASDPIAITAGAADSTPPASVTPVVSGRITVDISGYNETAQGDVMKYRVYVSKDFFSSVTGGQLLDGTTTPSVTGNGDNSLHFSSDIGTGLFYAEIPPGAEYPISLSGLTSNTYYFAVTAVDLAGNESAPVLIQVGRISGRVTDGVSGIPDVQVQVRDAACISDHGSASTDANGDYTIGYTPAGHYKVFFAAGASGYLNEWYNDKADCSTADTVSVTAPNTTTVNAVLAKGGRISGRVTDGAIGIPNVQATLYDTNCSLSHDYAFTDVNGDYVISNLPTGSYKVMFSAGGYFTEWYNDEDDCSTADTVSVTAPNTTPGIDAVLTRSNGGITGHVADGANAIAGVAVYLYDSTCDSICKFFTAPNPCGWTNANGDYVVSNLATGNYKVMFSAYGYFAEWYSDKADCSTADTASVTAPNTATVNAVLMKTGSISGRVTDGIAGIPYGTVTVYDTNCSLSYGNANTDANGDYTVYLADGNYKVMFSASGYVGEWYSDKADCSTAATVSVAAPDTTPGVDAVLAVGGRIAGTVTNGTTGIQGATVRVYDAAQNMVGSAYTAADGTFTVIGLPTGGYKVQFVCTPILFLGCTGGYASEWFNDRPDFNSAGVVPVTAPNTTTGINAVLTADQITLIQELIGNYYRNVLDRNPEQAGWDAWTSEIERLISLGIDIKEGFQALAKLFFNSAEYLLRGKSNDEFVTDLYQTFLNRQPDDGGKVYWVGQLQAGLTRDMLITAFANSEEFKLYLQGMLGTMNTRPENNLVNDLYRGFLNRLPDTAGFNWWLADNPSMNMRAAQCSGATAVRNLTYQIALAFMQSGEYTARNRNNSQYVEDLYNGILKRGADPAGYNYWVSLLDNQTYTRVQMLSDFTNSPEFQMRVQEVIDAGCLPR